MQIDRLLFLYTGISLYMIANYSFKTTCGITAGFYLWMTFVITVSRKINEQIYRYDIAIEFLAFLWGIYELYPWCYQIVVLCYVIFSLFNHLVGMIYYIYKYIHRDIPGITRPLISEMNEMTEIESV